MAQRPDEEENLGKAREGGPGERAEKSSAKDQRSQKEIDGLAAYYKPTFPDEHRSQPRGEDEPDFFPTSADIGARYQDAAVWVFIAAFAGLAIAWSTGMMALWVGALVGGGAAYLLGAAMLAFQGSLDSRRAVPDARAEKVGPPPA